MKEDAKNSTDIKMIAEERRVRAFERWIPNEKTLHYNQTCQHAQCPCIPQLNVQSQFLYLNGKSIRVCVQVYVCGLEQQVFINSITSAFCNHSLRIYYNQGLLEKFIFYKISLTSESSQCNGGDKPEVSN